MQDNAMRMNQVLPDLSGRNLAASNLFPFRELCSKALPEPTDLVQFVVEVVEFASRKESLGRLVDRAEGKQTPRAGREGASFHLDQITEGPRLLDQATAKLRHAIPVIIEC